MLRTLLLCALWAVTAEARLRVAVLPLQPVLHAKAAQAEWLEEKLHRELARRGVTVLRALPAAGGASDTRSCGVRCQTAVGKSLGADRVIAPWLSIQHGFTSQGTAWVWHMDQVDVASGAAWGSFEKLCSCPERWWDEIVATQVGALLAFDPKTELRLPPSAPKAAVSRGAREEPGMVFVPAGPFIMGTERGEWNDEAPRHLVELSAYWIDRTEVTNAAYDRCVEARACRPTKFRRHKVLGQAEHPVAGPSWFDAGAYCAFAGKRLPTEAEWEKAARGTDERVYPWGDVWDRKLVNAKGDADGFPESAPVGSFPRNQSPYGALDMAGNVWEWTADFYSQVGYRKSEKKDPTGPPKGRKRAMRGGSWMYDLPFFHTAHNRSPGRPEVKKRYVGFRCVKR